MKVYIPLSGRWGLLAGLAISLAAGLPVSQAAQHSSPAAALLADVQAPIDHSITNNSGFAGIELRTNRVSLVPGPEDPLISRLTTTLLVQSHYRQQPLNAEISSKFLDQYLDALDPSHLLFLQSDTEDFEAYRFKLHELLRRGDTSPAEKIFNRFMIRHDQQVNYVMALLKTNVFQFDSNESYPLSRKDAPRPKDLTEAQHLWRDRVYFEYLQEKLNDKKPAEIIDVIARRYARMQRFLKDWDNTDVLPMYLTALAHVYDPHSDYMGGAQMENFNIGMKLSLFGIGALLQSEDGYCLIKQLTPGGPAEKCGKLKPNDKIIAVAQGDEEPVDVVDMKLNKVVDLIRGPKDTKVRLTIIPANAADPSQRRTIVLIRDKIRIEESEAKAKIIELPDANKTRLGIIDLASFYSEQATTDRTNELKSTTADVSRLIERLKKEKVGGIILDLRRNGGGSLEEAIKLTGLFIAKGPVVQVKDFDGHITVDEDPDPAIAYDGPLLILTSRLSASASEILAGALQDYGRALIVGDSSTHGKGTVQQLIPLDSIMRRFGLSPSNNPGAVKITIRKFYLPNGSSTQLKGVVPDIVLPSVNNYAEVGESSLPNALPWDEIASSKFQPVNRIQPWLAELRKRSTERVSKDKDFDVIREEIDQTKKIQAAKAVSLNEQQRRKEKQEVAALLKARKFELSKRPEDKEKVFELTLKQVDLPDLQPFVPKTNNTSLFATRSTAPHVDVAAVAAAVPRISANQAPSVSVSNVIATFAAGTNTDAGIKTESTKPGDDEAKAEDDETPWVDAALNEAERILTDLITLSKSKADHGAEMSLAE